MTLPQYPQPELSHPCAHPGYCAHEAAEAETPISLRGWLPGLSKNRQA